MQRRSFVPTAALAAAAALTVGLAGCSGGSSAPAGDAKGGDPAALSQSGQPGRYSTLPDACRLPAESTVRSMLPGDGKRLSGDEAAQVYGGQADVTYDTDRRVGCRWKRETTAGTRHLTLDIQRVVSYDAKISDEDRAREVYGERALAAGVPQEGAESAPPSDEPSPSAKPGKDGGSGKGGKGGGKGGKADAPSGSPSPGTTAHLLDGLGDAGFLEDALATADSGVHRDITVVFRTSNVVVTLTYDQWSTDKTRVPESQELQDKAHALAEELADSLSE
ncbi:hypothetical protein [Streptomyces benahoarensis]|uniref:DUF3558 domain-containing protein n=1 Tax=Streptomyces benahoarensis TaxID=2595054 RepID=A0A553ZLM4_9ACTN|nr:hypothetical protein [Streptomyces benahoarensis]TSB42379.1 hypothetical protein FNZ23_10200 [Streptomyces benahoarensis]